MQLDKELMKISVIHTIQSGATQTALPVGLEFVREVMQK
jgi:hypothetical protein